MAEETGAILPFMPVPKAANNNQAAAIQFPTVYRLEGYRKTKPRMRKGVRRLPRYIREPVEYLFDPIEALELERPTWTAITNPDRILDVGWIIVRHHPNDDHLVGYMHDQIDWFSTLYDEYELSLITETPHGVFTMTHRVPPEGAPMPLLIHISRPYTEGQTIEERLSVDDEYAIYHADGTVTNDSELLFPYIRKLRRKRT